MRNPKIQLAIWVALIMFATVPWHDFQNHTHWMKVQWIPFVTPPVRLRDILINIAMYWPLGYLFARQSGDNRSWLRAALFALGLSLFTEWTQLYSHSRFPSLTDTTCNVVGTIWGAVTAARTVARRLAPSIEGGIS